MSESKYPISDMGADFQVDVMEDYAARVDSGEFAGKTDEQIRAIYVQEESDMVEQEEMNDVYRKMDEDEQRQLDRELDGDNGDD